VTLQIGAAAATASVLAGVFVMWQTAAPTSFVAVNLAALLVALALAASSPLWRRVPVPTALLVACAVGAIALPLVAGPSVEGVRRWLALGGLLVQPAAVLVPALALWLAGQRTWWATAAVIATAAALAAQPDRALAATLATALLPAAVMRRGWTTALRLAVALCAFAATLLRPDPLPPVPHVEGVVRDAFAASPALGTVALLGQAALLAPALDRSLPPLARATWVATWSTLVLAALVGDYPTPLTGYGASAILGYGLALCVLARMRRQE